MQGPVPVRVPPWTVQPEVDQAQISLLVHQSRSNLSLDDARRTFDELKSAVRLMERRLRDYVDSTDINNITNHINSGNDHHKDTHQVTTRTTLPSVHTAHNVSLIQSILQPNGPTAEERQRAKTISEYFNNLTRDVQLTDDIVRLLQQAVAMVFGEQRKARPNITIESPVVHRFVRRLAFALTSRLTKANISGVKKQHRSCSML